MKMDVIAGSKNDEFYTPAYAIRPIIEHLTNRNFKKIWCPFDSDQSLFVSELTAAGFDVTHTHLDNGYDFFKTQTPEGTDCVVSNPPYSIKGSVFKELFARKVNFAMLVGIVGIFESQNRFEMFKDNKFELMLLSKRIAYFKSYQEQKPSLNPPFSSVYVTSGVLPSQICFGEIHK